MPDTLDESNGLDGAYAGVTRTAEALDIETDEETLGRDAAETCAKAIGDGIRGITQPAREKHRLFNRSGRLANEIEALDWDGEGFPIAAPEGYLQDPALVERLISLVPALQEPLEDPQVEEALERALDGAVTKR